MVCFIWLLIFGVKKFLQNKCHLAAKLGTNSAVPLVIGRLHMDGRYLEVVFTRGFFLMIATFIRER